MASGMLASSRGGGTGFGGLVAETAAADVWTFRPPWKSSVEIEARHCAPPDSPAAGCERTCRLDGARHGRLHLMWSCLMSGLSGTETRASGVRALRGVAVSLWGS